MIRLLLPLALLALPVVAQNSPFQPGPLIPDYGPIAPVEGHTPIAPDTRFAVAFDTSVAGGAELNRTLESAARFLNMHVAADVPADRIRLAVVLHGRAVLDVTTKGGAGDGAANLNAPLVAALLAHGTRVVVCGQSAASLGVAKADLLPGVELALSAMTAHAVLQGEGYTLNPF